MKTLLNQKKLQKEEDAVKHQSQSPIKSSAKPQVNSQLKTENRITSAYYTTKIVKGLPLTIPMQQRTITKVPQLSYPFFSQPQQQREEIQLQHPSLAEIQQSKQTQVDPEEIRPVTSPLANSHRPLREVKDFKELMARVQYRPKKAEPQFVLQNKFPDFISNIDEFAVNAHVHKHLQKLKSGTRLPNYQMMPRNNSSKLERQRDLIEKTISSRPVQSQQIKRRLNSQIHSRPKTTAAPRPNAQAHQFNPLENQWMVLTQGAKQLQQQQAGQEQSLQEPERDLTHLDLQTNELTAKEREYIRKKRNYYLDNIRPYLEQVQQKAEAKRQQGNQNLIIGKGDQHNSLLSGFDNDIIEDDDEASFAMLEDDIKIFSQPLNTMDNFFAKAQPLNRSFSEQLKETQNKLLMMEKEDKKQQEDELRTKPDRPAAFLKAGEQFTQDEMKIILRELKKPNDERNFELLDGFCKSLKFFWQFSKQTRILLLKLSTVQHYKCSEYIFREGDEGDQMYIILDGACHVRIQNPHFPGTSPIVSTMYTGQQFGELALIDPNTKMQRPEQQNTNILQNQKYTLKMIRQEMAREEQNKEKLKNWWKRDQEPEERKEVLKPQPKRSASIECAIDTYLLAISRDYFKSIILNLITQELEDKLKTLMVMPCFEFLSQMELIPIANLLESQTYRLGEVILKEGEGQRYFYIIASGRCKMVKEEVFIRDLKSMGEEDPKRKQRLKCGLIDYAEVKADTKLRVKQLAVDLSEVEGSSIPQSFQYQEVYRNEEYMAFKYHFQYGDMVRGDHFMGRALLNEYKAFDEDIQELKYDLEEPSRLTVISDAARSEVYKLDKGLFHLITQPLKQHLIDGIKRKPEFDHVFEMDEATRTRKWDVYKMNLLRSIMENKQLKK